MTTDAVRRAAQRVLSRVGAEALPVDLEAIAQRLRVPVVRERLASDVTGAVVLSPAGAALLINTRQPEPRQRRVIAHLLGHVQLGHRFAEGHVHVDRDFEGYREERSCKGADRLEFEANIFGAMLLMPPALVRARVAALGHQGLTDTDIQHLASEFDVSVQGMTLRLAREGLL